MNKPNRGVLKAEGKAARSHAIERQGSGRISAASWYPEIEGFRDRGWKIAWIADACDLSERQIRRILTAGRDQLRKMRELPVKVDIAADLTDCLEFTADAFQRFFERFSGKPLPRHAKQWVQLFIDHPNIVINTPPRHAKTTIMVIWLTVWLLCMDRNEQILILSKTQRLAIVTARSIAMILESESIVRAFGRFAPDKVGEGGQKWAPGGGEFIVAGRTRQSKPGDLSVGSFGMDQQILGFEATVGLADDITDASVVVGKTAKVEEARKFREEFLSRIMPEGTTQASGRVAVIGQRVHDEDIYGDMASGAWDDVDEAEEADREFGWYFDVQQCVLDWENEITLWPEERNMRWVRLTRRRVGSHAFETMYQQNPRPSGSTSIPQEWIDDCKDKSRSLGEGFRAEEATQTLPIARVMSVDPSPTEWNAAVIADVVSTREDWACGIIDVRRWKGRLREFRVEVERAISLYEIDYLIIEESTYLSWIFDDPWFTKIEKRVKVVKHHTGMNKRDHEVGADSLARDFEMRAISLPWGDRDAMTASQLLINEAVAWPLSKLYDVFMALWFIKFNRKKLKAIQTALLNNFGGKNPELNASGRAMKMAQDRESVRRKMFRLAS